MFRLRSIHKLDDSCMFFNFAWRFEDGNNTVTMKCMVNETWNGTESNCTGMSTYYIQT